ncbi:UbiA family prenyltransferase [Nostoc sp. NIES-2111]
MRPDAVRTEQTRPVDSTVEPISAPVPLCVDLDGTLLRTNSLFEVCWFQLRRHPWLLLQIPFWLLRGQAYLWSRLEISEDLPIATWPCNPEVLSFLAEQRPKRPLYLVTGSSQRLAERFAQHLGIFSGVFATQDKHLVGPAKAEFLAAHFGPGRYDYIGDSQAEFTAWRGARQSFTVESPLLNLAQAFAHPLTPLAASSPRRPWAALWRALRPYQWSKNLLVFLPPALGHSISQAPQLLASLVAFTSFSLCSSAVYLLNDCLDLESDRTHPTKSRRPLASGDLPLPHALAATAALFLLSFALAAVFCPAVLLVLGVYLAASTFYTVYAKTLLVVDLVLLAAFYVLRIFAGSLATQVPVSFWLNLFSLFLFFGLATLKRCAELQRRARAGSSPNARRAYRNEDLLPLSILGSASHLLAVLVVGLYIHTPDVARLYPSPQFLWLICPIVLAWGARLWLLSGRGEIEEDPISFALRDRWSHTAALFALASVWLAAQA